LITFAASVFALRGIPSSVTSFALKNTSAIVVLIFLACESRTIRGLSVLVCHIYYFVVLIVF
jgi:hypothetical protein